MLMHPGHTMIGRPTADAMLWLDRHDVARSVGAFSSEVAQKWALQPWAIDAASETSARLAGNLLRWNDTRPDDRRALVGQLALRWTSWRMLIVEVWDNGNPRCSPAWPERDAWAT
ncbi:hypothetical protein [Nocardia alni]|uniref:hypothetical protein n=1 Tax=Nocardia alni TaxID=2815723 RepID=UPI001C24B5C9|nr:hypothetical protein [Nocardia alni]